LGVNAHDMIFSNPVKEENDIEFAAKSGVLFTTADSFDELIKIKRIAPNMKILWRISIVEDQA
jgi:diaminopimelate decarboxylase